MMPITVENPVEIEIFNNPVEARLKRSLFRTTGGRTTDVESTHCKLGTGLTNGLRCNNPYSLTKIYQMPSGEIAAVTRSANTALTLAGQNGPNLNSFDAGIFDTLHQTFIDLLICFNQHISGHGVENIFQSGTAQDPVTKAFDDFATFCQRRQHNTIKRITVLLGNDSILRNIDKATGQVTRVSSFKRGIRQTLTRTVCRNKILQHGKAFPEVCGNRRLDNLPGRLGHKSTHPGELSYLLGTTTSTRIGHHVNRIK